MNELRLKNRREQQKEKTRKSIIQAALKHFSKCGFHGASVREIHKSSNVSGNILYHYFPGGKEELIKVIGEEALINIESQLNQNKSYIESLPILDALEAIYQSIDDIFNNHFEEIKLIMLKMDDVDQNVKTEFIHMIKNKEKWLPNLLSKKAQIGEINQMDFKASSTILISIYAHHFMLKLSGFNNGPLTDDANRNKIFKQLINQWKGL